MVLQLARKFMRRAKLRKISSARIYTFASRILAAWPEGLLFVDFDVLSLCVRKLDDEDEGKDA